LVVGRFAALDQCNIDSYRYRCGIRIYRFGGPVGTVDGEVMNLFFTADEHIGHGRVNALERMGRCTGIIHLAKRPFSSLEEMKQTIITRHNQTVTNSNGNLTVHVGDWFWDNQGIGDILDYIHELNGRHAFMFGNHDEAMEKYGKFLLDGNHVDWIHGENKAGGAKIFRWNKHIITVDHFARRVWERSHKGGWHVYAHSHGALPPLGKSFDIGVDGHDFRPWSLEEIEAKMETLEQHHTIDNRGNDHMKED
jgi:calcineurin-like phosphoesterase family protein